MSDELTTVPDNQTDPPLSRGATIAKGGYDEERWIVSKLHGTSDPSQLEIALTTWHNIPIPHGPAQLIPDKKKSDFRYGTIGVQWKRTSPGQFGQIARHNVDHMIEHIPGLQPVADIINTMCVFPIDGNSVTRPIIRTRLTPQFMPQETLDQVVERMTIHKRSILEYAILGTDIDMIPDLFGISIYKHKPSMRHSIQVWKTNVLIDYLNQYPVRIRKSGTVIEIGDAFTIQRKGGDSGAPSSNQIQFKLIPTKIPKDLAFQYTLQPED